MKIYENDGILKIKKAYRAAETLMRLNEMNKLKPNTPYDPDTQTEYANQMTNSHMCLYEFKESAEFIAFTDWDDVLVGPNFGQTLATFADSFHKLSVAYPFAVAYAIPRFPFDPFSYSHSQLFHKLIYKCYAPIEKAAQDDSLMICPTHKACIYPEQNITVIKVQTTHKSSKLIGGYIWHERDIFNFVESKKGCL
uniref:Glycosyltransferase family 92 protein n=1 Tax=Panagrolaimus sp. ES5 TaxID=591445 RepID=A0AC34F9I3_9BILA